MLHKLYSAMRNIVLGLGEDDWGRWPPGGRACRVGNARLDRSSIARVGCDEYVRHLLAAVQVHLAVAAERPVGAPSRLARGIPRRLDGHCPGRLGPAGAGRAGAGERDARRDRGHHGSGRHRLVRVPIGGAVAEPWRSARCVPRKRVAGNTLCSHFWQSTILEQSSRVLGAVGGKVRDH